MYKNPIFNDNSLQKTIKSHPDIIFFQNSLKYSKYASISPTIFFQKKFAPPFLFHLPVATVQWKITGG